jgi:hypothetical protein
LGTWRIGGRCDRSIRHWPIHLGHHLRLFLPWSTTTMIPSLTRAGDRPCVSDAREGGIMEHQRFATWVAAHRSESVDGRRSVAAQGSPHPRIPGVSLLPCGLVVDHDLTTRQTMFSLGRSSLASAEKPMAHAVGSGHSGCHAVGALVAHAGRIELARSRGCQPDRAGTPMERGPR